ncbi:MAG TPA: serine hydrolase [Edaphobacter sp.]|nr:serine hydrolase [Edaphobacter sp.]
MVSFLALILGVSANTVHAQRSESAKQRMDAVESHLARYVTIANGRNDLMTLASQMAELGVPAVSIAAIRDGRIDWARAYGVSSLHGPPATTRTLFGAASISKPVTALGVLKLVEQGKIDLDTDVNQYLKRWKIPENEFTEKQKVTVRELLNHTSGIGTHNGVIYDSASSLPSLLQMLDGETPAKTAPVRVEAVPGTKFAYANGGYLVLCLLIEDVTEESFSHYMKQTVLQPMGMNDSTFDAPLPPKLAQHAATSYFGRGKVAPPENFIEPNLAAGGLWSTPTDLAKFLIEVQREYAGTSHKVLHQRTIRAIVTQGNGQTSARSWGLGFEVGGKPDNLYVRHGGSAYFQDDMVAYLRGGGLVVMTSGGDGGILAEQLLRSAATVYDFPDFKPVERAVVEVNPSSLSRFVGTYAYIEVALEGGFLTAEIPKGAKPVRLYPESPTRFFVIDQPQELDFDVDAEQNVTGVEFITSMAHHSLKKEK